MLDRSCREEEVVAELQDPLLEGDLGPDQLQVVPGIEPLGGAHVRGRRCHPEEVAVRVHGLAALEPEGVEGDHQDVVDEVRDVLAVLEALQVEVQQGARARPGLVHWRDDHRPVLHGHLRQ